MNIITTIEFYLNVSLKWLCFVCGNFILYNGNDIITFLFNDILLLLISILNLAHSFVYDA